MGQLVEFGLVEVGAGLEGVALDVVEGDLEGFAGWFCYCRDDGRLRLAAGREGRRDSRPFPRARRLGSVAVVMVLLSVLLMLACRPGPLRVGRPLRGVVYRSR